MKKTIIFCIFLSIGLTTANARNYIIGIAPDYTKHPDYRTVTTKIVETFVNQFQPGDSLAVFDAYQNRVIIELDIPNKPFFANSKVKLKTFNEQLASMIANLKNIGEKSSNQGYPIQLPQFIDYLATLKLDQIAESERNVSILLIGSALYTDQREQAIFSMRDGFFPSDGHLKQDKKGSLYGTAGKANRLKGVTIHQLYTDLDWMSDLYQFRIKRFWSLFTSLQGGDYATFTNDPVIAFERFVSPGAHSTERYSFDHTADKVEMLRVRREPVKTSTSVQENDHSTDADNFMNNNVKITNEPVTIAKGKIKVGIGWSCKKCDLDLYARSSPNSQWLYYGHQLESNGRHIKDFTSSPDIKNGLEYIEYTEDIDLSQLELMVNFYAGESPGGPDGIIRAYLDGRVYEAQFKIPAENGNRGDKGSGVSNSNYWYIINVKNWLGINHN